jgi:hypothetical protein
MSNCAGNFWGLIARLNRGAQDDLPDAKFDRIMKDSEDGSQSVWPRDRWWLTDAEIQEFREIGRELTAGVHIDAAMDRFHNLVRTRALRMTDEVFRRLPEAVTLARTRPC